MVSSEGTCAGSRAPHSFAGSPCFPAQFETKSVPECPGNAKALQSP